MIIVNADDFGWDENRTMAISESFRKGLVTTTTVMANMPWFEKSLCIARDGGFLGKVGLHLCLTEGVPLTNPIRKSRLFCDEHGCFNKRFHLNALTRLWLPAFERRAVAEEAAAQMKRYLDSGLTYCHLDSHHHAHTDFSIARIVLPMAKKMGFKTVRMARDIGTGMSLANRSYKKLINAFLGRDLQRLTDHFGSLQDFCALGPGGMKGGSVEIMVHPVYRSGDELDLSGEFMDGLHGSTKMLEIAEVLKRVKGNSCL